MFWTEWDTPWDSGWESHTGEEAALFRPHLEAIRASVHAGFRFRHLPSHANLSALQGFRTRSGAMDMYLARDTHDAFAVRVLLEDLQHPRTPPPLWHDTGPVADVIHALLEIPEHNTPGAPQRPMNPPSELLWIPGSTNTHLITP